MVSGLTSILQRERGAEKSPGALPGGTPGLGLPRPLQTGPSSRLEFGL